VLCIEIRNMHVSSTGQLQQINVRMPGRNQIAHEEVNGTREGAEVNGTREGAEVLKLLIEGKTKTYGCREFLCQNICTLI
jgi:hypothetical protein